MTDFSNLAKGLLPEILSAGKIIIHYFRRGCEIQTKAGGSPVTIADHEAEAALIKALSKLTPDIPVIGEEMMEGQPATPMDDDFFLVDALDGTREFTSGRNEFTINVGLIHKGEPTFGVIYAPALSQLYMTLNTDHAAFAKLSPDVASCSLETMDFQRMAVKNDVTNEGPFVICASRSHGSDALENWLANISISRRTNIGSSLKFCQVAEGKCDVYPRFGPTMEWDTAAGQAIVQASGGIVAELDGSPLRYGKHETGFRNPFFIAAAISNPKFFHEKVAG